MQNYMDRRTRARGLVYTSEVLGFTREREALSPQNSTFKITRITPISTAKGKRRFTLIDLELVPSAIIQVKGGKPTKAKTVPIRTTRELYSRKAPYNFEDNTWDPDTEEWED
jgi:hypothetical protein